MGNASLSGAVSGDQNLEMSTQWFLCLWRGKIPPLAEPPHNERAPPRSGALFRVPFIVLCSHWPHSRRLTFTFGFGHSAICQSQPDERKPNDPLHSTGRI